MNVASLKLCRELYELSGWFTDAGLLVHKRNTFNHWQIVWLPGYIPVKDELYPAYDLGYLLRKLPFPRAIDQDSFAYIAKYENHGKQVWERADTPENAAAKLAIELFKQGVLQREVV